MVDKYSNYYVKKWEKKKPRNQRVRDRFFNRYPNCYYCNVALDKNNRTIDHFTPLSKGGSKAKQNWRASCNVCNIVKGNKIDFVSEVIYE